jgi:hypothetical protein
MISKELFSLEDSAMLVSSKTSFSSADGSKCRVVSFITFNMRNILLFHHIIWRNIPRFEDLTLSRKFKTKICVLLWMARGSYNYYYY